MHDWHHENDDEYYEHLEAEDQYVGDHAFLRDRSDRLAAYPRTPDGDITLTKENWSVTLVWNEETGITINVEAAELPDKSALGKFNYWLMNTVKVAAADYDTEKRTQHAWDAYGLVTHQLYFADIGTTTVWIGASNKTGTEDLTFGTPYITWDPNFSGYVDTDPEWACSLYGLEEDDEFRLMLPVAHWNDDEARTRLANFTNTAPNDVLIQAALINSPALAHRVEIMNTTLELNALHRLPTNQKINYLDVAELLNSVLPPESDEHWARARVWPISSYGMDRSKNLDTVTAISTYTPEDNETIKNTMNLNGYHTVPFATGNRTPYITVWSRTPNLFAEKPYAYKWYNDVLNTRFFNRENFDNKEDLTFLHIAVPIEEAMLRATLSL